MAKTSVVERNPALGDMSIEEIEELLAEKQAKAAQEKIAKRKQYEDAREEMINTLSGFAQSLSQQMLDLKLEAFRELTAMRERMMEYGEIRRGVNNKGNFEIKNEKYKIKFSSQVNKGFDERAKIAEEKMKEFLSSFVRKKDKSAYNLIMGLIQRNEKTGDFDYDLINRLYKMKDQFDNPLWKEALELFQESYAPYGTAQYVQFFVKNETNNAWEPVVLDFAKLRGLPASVEELKATGDEQETA